MDGTAAGSRDERRDQWLRWSLATLVAAVVSLLAIAVLWHGGADPVTATRSAARTCEPARAPSGDQRVVEGSVSVGETLRGYRLTLPPSYDGVRPVPLVVLLHGTGGTIDGIEDYTGMVPAAGQRGYAVLTPQGLGAEDGSLPTHWTVPGFDPPGSPDDVAFVSGLVDTVTRAYCVDAGRVFATGMSAGAAFSTELACQTDVLAGIAPVSGMNLVPPCAGARPLTVLTIHGTDDALVAYGGVPSTDTSAPTDATASATDGTATGGTTSDRAGTGAEAASPSGSPTEGGALRPFYNGPVVDDVARWAAAFGCSDSAQGQVSPDVTSTTYTGCRGDVTVTLWTVQGGGHQWPGGATVRDGLGYQTDTVSATQAILDAFDAAPAGTVVLPATG